MTKEYDTTSSFASQLMIVMIPFPLSADLVFGLASFSPSFSHTKTRQPKTKTGDHVILGRCAKRFLICSSFFCLEFSSSMIAILSI